jgi:hypothetical protein
MESRNARSTQAAPASWNTLPLDDHWAQIFPALLPDHPPALLSVPHSSHRHLTLYFRSLFANVWLPHGSVPAGGQGGYCLAPYHIPAPRKAPGIQVLRGQAEQGADIVFVIVSPPHRPPPTVNLDNSLQPSGSAKPFPALSAWEPGKLSTALAVGQRASGHPSICPSVCPSIRPSLQAPRPRRCRRVGRTAPPPSPGADSEPPA